MTTRPTTTPVFILAGGEGQRLAPLTEAKPKPAVSFGGTHQILDFTLSNCVNSGLKKIYVLTQYKREPLHDYVRQNRLLLSSRFQWHDGDDLRCVAPVSGKRYRGTADAVFQSLPLIRFDTAEHVLVASGDHIYSMDYRQFLTHHAMSGADMTIGTVRRPVGEASAFGVVDTTDGGAVVGFREKPGAETLPTTSEVLVNMGVYAFKRTALLAMADTASPMETDFGRHFIPKLVRSGKVAAYDFDCLGRNYWRDVGSLDSYYRASMDLVGPDPGFDLDRDKMWPIHTLTESSVFKLGYSRISCRALTESSTIRHSVISYGACIEAGAVVENSVVLPGALIAAGAHVRNAIITEKTIVENGCRIGMDPDADRRQFLVTPEGVVVVSGPARGRRDSDGHGWTPSSLSVA
jgi:glucose-1-phosphate adenylyltransferase